jgi:hypothetical protein
LLDEIPPRRLRPVLFAIAGAFACDSSKVWFVEPGTSTSASAATTGATTTAGPAGPTGSTGGSSIVTGPTGPVGGAGGRGGAGGDVGNGEAGVCNRDCPNAPCARLAAAWRTVATSTNFIKSLAIGADAIYVGTTSSSPLTGGDIERIPIAGGAPTPFVTNVQAMELLLDGDSLYYVDNISRGQSYSLRVIPTSGGSHVTLASDSLLSNIRVDATYAYYSTQDGSGAARILRVARDGSMSPPEVVVETKNTWGFDIDADAVYWASVEGSGSLLRRPLAGGVTTTLATSMEPIAQPFVHGEYVYFFHAATPGVCEGAVLRVPRAGGAVELLSPGNTGAASFFGGLAFDDAYVYWAQIWYDDGWLVRAPLGGGTPELLVTGLIVDGLVTGTATDLYFAARPAGSSTYEVRAIGK